MILNIRILTEEQWSSSRCLYVLDYLIDYIDKPMVVGTT